MSSVVQASASAVHCGHPIVLQKIVIVHLWGDENTEDSYFVALSWNVHYPAGVPA
jgi:hypothetical protein